MKTTRAIAVSFAFFFTISLSSIAQNTKIIAVINRADWCGTCQKHERRASSALYASNNNQSVVFIVNDITNDATKEKSNLLLTKHGLNQIIKSYKNAGMVYFFDFTSKKFIDKISISKKDEQLRDKLTEALVK